MNASWGDDAACLNADPELWYPPKSGTVKPAKQICRTCPVQPECLETALENNEEFGVWGGLSAKERRRLLRQQRRRRDVA